MPFLEKCNRYFCIFPPYSLYSKKKKKIINCFKRGALKVNSGNSEEGIESYKNSTSVILVSEKQAGPFYVEIS